MAAEHRPALPALGETLRHRGRELDVQTVDRGVGSPHIVSNLFFEGQLLLGRTVAYAATAAPLEVREFMRAHHARLLSDLAAGALDQALAGVLPDAPVQNVTLPPAHRAPRRARVDRADGVGLASVTSGRAPEDVAARVMEAVAARAGASLDEESDGELVAQGDRDDAVAIRGEVAVPIGWVEAGLRAGHPWLGGDMLASTAWLARAEDALARGEELPGDAVLEGALPEDLRRAWG